MPRVAAGSIGPGWGCTCPSSLRSNQILKGMANASLVSVEPKGTEPDGTMVFQAFTKDDKYTVTFNPRKPGKICKHAVACSAYVVGDWLSTGLVHLRGEMEECREAKKQLKAVERVVTRLGRRFTTTPSTT